MKDIADRIEQIRAEMGERLLILGHHYQRQSVLLHADAKGDSLELARLAATRSNAEKIVFCGVHFMAESADILSGQEQTVFMPDSSAGCPMANMASAEDMVKAWKTLNQISSNWLPVVYVNSTAEIKALCGKLGGATCTSSNAAAVFKWAFDQGKKVLFLPDEHLGVNTAADAGLHREAVVRYDPALNDGGLTPEQINAARVVVWKGFCIVHQAFSVNLIKSLRDKYPGCRIIVHPESPRAVVAASDAHGSTAQIIRYVEQAEDGAVIVVGTEHHLVERLAIEHAPRVKVVALRSSVCANMARTNEENLLALLESFPPRAAIHVDPAIAADAELALRRMLEIV